MSNKNRRFENNTKENESLKVTTLMDLQRYKTGKIVRLPDFADGQPLIARVRRPSLLVLAKSGKIPNTLLGAAGQLFSGGKADEDNPRMLEDLYDVCHVIAEATLVEPTLEQIESVGLNLSDEQMMVIFNYSQIGSKALETFRNN